MSDIRVARQHCLWTGATCSLFFPVVLPAGSQLAGSTVCLYGLNFGLGATAGANFLGVCCWETEMLALPKDGVVSILAATCPVWLLPFPGFHMVLWGKKKTVIDLLSIVTISIFSVI